MSEAVVNRLAFPDDIAHHPPSKKIRLSSEEVGTPCTPLTPPPSTTPFQTTSESSYATPSNDDDDIFDPIEEILQASRKCQEEEERRHNSSSEQSSALKNNNEEHVRKDNTNEKPNESGEGGVVSDSDDDIPSDSEVTNSKKSEDGVGKPNGLEKSGKTKKKKKSKSSNMRRNIKDILTHDQLDDLTIAARKEEEERRQRMNQKLKLLQEQQQQLIKETLADSSSYDNFNLGFTPPLQQKFSSDLLLKRLMRKKHITVSLDESGIPKQNETNDDECILLSSDDEQDSEKIILPQPPEMSQVPLSFNSNLHYPSHFYDGSVAAGVENRAEIQDPRTSLETDEVIALSSGEEDDNGNDNHEKLLKNVRLHEGVTDPVGEREAENAESDDDCVIISPGPGEGEEIDDKDECSQDLINVPDHLGRVLVNVGHPEEDADLFLPPQIAKIVKPHQIGGIRFLYDNLVESKERYTSSSGFGCILAHAMGLGKTLQTVSFCDVFLRTSGKTVLIIVPINTIQNWVNEFNRYLPRKENSNSKNENSIKRRTKSKSLLKLDANSINLADENPNSRDSLDNTSLNMSIDSNQCLESNENAPEEINASTSSSSQIESSQENVGITSSPPAESEISYRTFDVYLLNETIKSLQARENTIATWSAKGGVLLIGYEMYRMLALKRLKKSTRKVMEIGHDQQLAEAYSLDNIYQCLVNPGPDCVICDEGHRIKNSGAGISQALKAVATKRRVVLTGYPLQNNLMEYWCMVDFVRPNYLGTKAEFSNMFERPIQNGQCADSTFDDKRTMKHRSHVLHSLLEGFVQRRSHVVLRNALPQKQEWVFLVRLTPIQLKIYREFIRYLKEDLDSENATTNPIKAFAVCCKIWNHPDVLWNVVKKNLDLETDLDIEEDKSTTVRPKVTKARRGTGRPRGRPPLNGFSSYPSHPANDLFENDQPSRATEVTPASSGISIEWAKPLFEQYASEVMENGVKFELLFMLIKETVKVGDKLLVFSQSLLTLDLMEIFLKGRLNWAKSVDYVRLDGSTAGLEREKLIDQFNKSSTLKLFIISTRAGSLGINLVGANRVILFDASWNPCHDSQAVCRVYRYGQIKPCYIYRFVADCTLEKRIYDRQVNKKGMADRIVDEMNPNTPFKSKDVSSFLVLQHDLLEKLPFIRCNLTPEKYTDPVMRNVLQEIGDKITQEPFEHESLLIDQKHQKLSKSEKRMALRNYEKDKQQVQNQGPYSRQSYAQYYPPASSENNSSRSSSYPMSSYNNPLHSRRYESSGIHGRNCSTTLSSSSNNTAGSDDFERHIAALNSRGILTFRIRVDQETTISDPSGSRTIYLRAGDTVYLIASQKGTYLRMKDKMLKVPFLGTDVSQEIAEKHVFNVFRSQLRATSSSLSSPIYPVEQKLPPTNNLMFQKNPNHLQISNSRSNTGGDVMMGSSGSYWHNGSGEGQNHHYHEHPHQQSNSTPPSVDNTELLARLKNYGSSNCMSSESYSPMHLGSGLQSHSSSRHHHSSETNLQSLSRLTETFCNSFPYPQSQPESSSSSLHRWSSPLASKSEPLHVAATGDLEVIKLNHSQSSNSSTSSNSRTNSPYNKINWNNNSSNDGSASVGSSAAAGSSWGKSKDPSYYTDFTITPVGSRRPYSRDKNQCVDNMWDNGNNNDSRSPVSNELLRHVSTSSISMAMERSSPISNASNNGTSILPQLQSASSLQQYLNLTGQYGDLPLFSKLMMNSHPNLGMNFPVENPSHNINDDLNTTPKPNNESLRKLLIGTGSSNGSNNTDSDKLNDLTIASSTTNMFNSLFNFNHQNQNNSGGHF